MVALLEPGAAASNLDGLDVERRDGRHHPRRRSSTAPLTARASASTWPPSSASGRKDPVQRSTRSTSRKPQRRQRRRRGRRRAHRLHLDRRDARDSGDTKAGRPSNEDDVADLSHLYGNYKQTKYVAEHEVLRLAAQGAPVVLVLPTMPHGPYDHRPTPSGKVVLDYLNGRIPGFVDTAMNVAHVDDLADGHLLALENGPPGPQLHLRRREHHHGAAARASSPT